MTSVGYVTRAFGLTILGLSSILLMLSVAPFVDRVFSAEALRVIVDALLVTTYFGLCQFLLSMHHPDAVARDWRLMLPMVLPLCVVVAYLIIMLENWRRLIVLDLVLLVGCAVLGTYVGAHLAANYARHHASKG